jgi:DNA-binding CsgD family transcriptional regulator
MSSHPSASVGTEHQRHAEAASKRERMKLIIVNSERHVILDSIDPTEHELRLLLSDDGTKLRVDVDGVVEALIEQCALENVRHSRIAFLDVHRFVRVTRLNGRDGRQYAISVEHFRSADSLSRATRKYQLTPREIDVLAMILEGASASETAHALKIAETTVQGYYKRLLSKTQSRNRPAMVANVLDWGGSGRRQRREPER